MFDSSQYKITFQIPGIPGQTFPVYALSKKGRITNWKSIVYPSPTSAKRFTRRKQLIHRSQQAKFFDMLINIGYFQGLGDIVKEMPILIENSKRIPDLPGGLFFLLDYWFPSLSLAVELDSDYHDNMKDEIRDKFLMSAYGIQVFRIRDLQKESVQKKRFHEFTALLKSIIPDPNPAPLIFTGDLYQYLSEREKRSR